MSLAVHIFKHIYRKFSPFLGGKMKNYPKNFFRKAFPTLIILSMLITTLGITVPAQAGIVSGLSEFYIPMAADQIWDIFEDNDNNPDLIEATGIHYAIGLTASTDNTNIFYDHWEDGYDFDTTDLTGADETYAASQGEVLTFESSNVPNNPRGTTLAAFLCSGRCCNGPPSSLASIYWYSLCIFLRTLPYQTLSNLLHHSSGGRHGPFL